MRVNWVSVYLGQGTRVIYLRYKVSSRHKLLLHSASTRAVAQGRSRLGFWNYDKCHVTTVATIFVDFPIIYTVFHVGFGGLMS